LNRLITDMWVSPRDASSALYPGRIRERSHAELIHTEVSSANLGVAAFEAHQRLKRVAGWDRIINRNDWFQRHVIRCLSALPAERGGTERVLFSFSYTALRPFQFAKSLGWSTVLGQIDAGPSGEAAFAKAGSVPDKLGSGAPPLGYWQQWRQECDLADAILVNSAWSAEALRSVGVAGHKLHVVPLAYEAAAGASAFRRTYPREFSKWRPLRLLFLGQVTIGKGAAVVLEALDQLGAEPLEVWFVGARRFEVEERWLVDPRVHWVGAVPRSETALHYQQADVFLFPTFSDGFGLTQLEAQSWKLPVVASRFCGDVVRDGVNGVLLESVSPSALANAIRSLLAQPNRLASMSQAASTRDFSLERLGTDLRRIGAQLARSRAVHG